MTLLTSSKFLFQELVSEITAVYDENEAKTIVYLLLNHFLKLSKSDILLDEKVNQCADFYEIIKRLKSHEPIQYIIGETEFYGRKFKVTTDTLIPRPETEELVQLSVISYQSSGERSLRNNEKHDAKPKILDIGTGSGCIAVSLACELPDAQVYAYDISEQALRIAKENAERNGANVIFEKVNILESSTVYHSPFTVIVSNPPYVMNSEKSEMEKNVLDYEPYLALFVEDDDPLIFYKKIAEFSAKNLTKKGLCIVEINQAFGLETAELFWNEGFSYVEVVKDMFGKDRFVKAIL
jgi:release factor glutamine methyltransferase